MIKSGITKKRGIEVLTLLHLILLMILEKSNSIYQGIIKNGLTSFKSSLNEWQNSNTD